MGGHPTNLEVRKKDNEFRNKRIGRRLGFKMGLGCGLMERERHTAATGSTYMHMGGEIVRAGLEREWRQRAGKSKESRTTLKAVEKVLLAYKHSK